MQSPIEIRGASVICRSTGYVFTSLLITQFSGHMTRPISIIAIQSISTFFLILLLLVIIAIPSPIENIDATILFIETDAPSPTSC